MTPTPTVATSEQPVHKAALRKIYPHLLAELGEASGKLRAFFYGGRSLGKSTLLETLAYDAADRNRHIFFIEGKSGHGIHRILVERAAAIRRGDAAPDLYLDDIDHLLSSLLRNEMHDTADHILSHLNFLLSKVPAGKGRFFISSALSPSRLSELVYSLRQPELDAGLLREFFSFVLEQKFECIRLDPWSYRWQERLGELVRIRLSKATSAYFESCRVSILELTGGHPALLIQCLHELNRLVTGEELDPVEQGFAQALGERPKLDPQQFGVLLERHLEDVLVQTGLQPLRLSIGNLRNAEGPDLRDAWQSLVALAQGVNEFPPPKLREILLDEGLIYKSKESGAYVVPGRLVIREILSVSADGHHRPALMLAPNPEAPNVRGELVIRSGLKRETIELSESMWVLLTLFIDDPDRIFTPEELQKHTGLTSDAAVRSAIQRLIAKLRAGGLESVVENVYGKGYRKGSEPHFRAR